MLTIGLTGGIGSGKSTVVGILSELGAPVLDADQVGHAIYAPGGPAYAEVVNAFGKEILRTDGTIDRKKLGPIVFSDPRALKRLNSIVHPRMFEQMRQTIVRMRAEGERLPIVIEAAVLIEANWQPLCDRIWLVTATRDRVIERVRHDRGLSAAEVEARLRAQLPDRERRRHASLVIENNGTMEELRAEVSRLWGEALRQSN